MMRVEERWNAAGDSAFCIVELGISYYFSSCTVQQLEAVIRDNSDGMKANGYTPSPHYTYRSDPTTMPEIKSGQPCDRCGAPIRFSPYFSKGRPCDCLAGKRGPGRLRSVLEVTSSHAIRDGAVSLRINNVRRTPMGTQVVLTLANGTIRRLRSTSSVFVEEMAA